MNKNALLVLRFGLAVIFLWLGALVYLSPSVWASLLLPWARHATLFGSLKPTLRLVAAFDVIVGLFLIFNLWPWAVALAGIAGLLIALVSMHPAVLTFPLIGLIVALLALFLLTAPKNVRKKFRLR
jgi:hypothetical protein